MDLWDSWNLWDKAKHSRPAWIEIDMQALRDNFANIKWLVEPGCKIAAVVKADAYGHGAVPVARCLLAEGASRLAVATLGEALELRVAGIEAPIMLLGTCGEEGVAVAVAQDVILPVYSLEMARQISAAAGEQGKTAAVQLVVDTGMGRIGFLPSEAAVREIVAINALPNLRIDGMFSHFAASDEADKGYAEQQLAKYQEFAASLATAGVNLPLKTIANSAAIMELPNAHFDMVRAGIILYGYHPSNEVDKSLLALKPVMSIKARLTHVKDVPAGTSISYGRTFTTSAPARIATVPVGYADGWRRLQSNNGEVLVGGRRVPIVGRVCMDQFMIDVTGLDVRVGDEVVLLGTQGDERIDADEIAARCGTISYEILSAVLPRLSKKYINM
jgi:alanine racemase